MISKKVRQIQCNGAAKSERNNSKSTTCALDLDILGKQIQHLLKVIKNINLFINNTNKTA